MKKRIIGITITAVAILAVSAFFFVNWLSDGYKRFNAADLPIISFTDNTEPGCMEINWNNKVYRPYGTCGKNELGELLGFTDEERTDGVYYIKNCEDMNFLATMLNSGLMDSPMVYKAVGADDAGFEKYKSPDYEIYDVSE